MRVKRQWRERAGCMHGDSHACTCALRVHQGPALLAFAPIQPQAWASERAQRSCMRASMVWTMLAQLAPLLLRPLIANASPRHHRL